MNKAQIPAAVKSVRRDLTDWVWHLVRRDGHPQETFRSIITERTLCGGLDQASGETVICFSEAPLRELMNQDEVLSQKGYKRLALYGVGFRKQWLFDRGGLPVIYQPDSLMDNLLPKARWRHVEFDLSKPVDYTWQREWRIRAESLTFEIEDAVALIRNIDGLEDLLWKNHIDVQDEQGEIMISSEVFKEIDFVPLEFADVDDDSSIEVCTADDYVDGLTDDNFGRLDMEGP